MAARGADPAKLEALIRNAGLSFRPASKSWVFDCPLCGKSDRLWMYKASGRFKCWSCAETRGFRGAPEFALKELTGRKIADLRAELYGDEIVPAGYFLGFELDEYGEEDDEVEDTSFPGIAWDPNCKTLDHPHAKRGVAYLAGRGIDVATAMQYGIRYNPAERAVAFPVYVGDQLAGWQYRIIYDDGGGKVLKIWTVGENFREKCVMFSNRLMTVSHAVLCEGPVDALKAHLVGGNVASMGKAVSAGQIRVLLNAGIRKLYLALDPDAEREIEPLMEQFDDVPVHLVKVPPGFKDLGAMTMEAARDAILAAPQIHRGLMFASYWK